MTIYLYSGTPGSGKSYAATEKLRRALKRGQTVVANFEIAKDDRCKGDFIYVPNNELSVDRLLFIAREYWAEREPFEDGLLVVLDEAQLLWNSRLWQDKERMRWLELWSQHRKYFLQIVLIAQSDIMIDKQFRTLIEYECNHRKIGNYGAFGKLLRLMAFGEIFYQVTYFYAQKYKVDGRVIRYRKKIGNMYNSYKAFDRQETMQQISSYQLIS